MSNKKKKDKNVDRMRRKSGRVNDNRLLVGFLYYLMRDLVTPGRIEGIMLELSNQHDVDTTDIKDFQFTNGWLAKYCQDVADRLLQDKITQKDPSQMLEDRMKFKSENGV